jgi:hypothetical protein
MARELYWWSRLLVVVLTCAAFCALIIALVSAL